MLADVPQEGDVFQLFQPLGIIDHDSIGWAIAKGKKSLKHPANGCDILRNRVSGQKLARLILEAGIADLAGATAHDHDGLVPCALQLAQHHDGYQMADVQRRRSRIEARSEEHTSELQSLMRISYAVFCLKKKNHN